MAEQNDRSIRSDASEARDVGSRNSGDATVQDAPDFRLGHPEEINPGLDGTAENLAAYGGVHMGHQREEREPGAKSNRDIDGYFVEQAFDLPDFVDGLGFAVDGETQQFSISQLQNELFADIPDLNPIAALPISGLSGGGRVRIPFPNEQGGAEFSSAVLPLQGNAQTDGVLGVDLFNQPTFPNFESVAPANDSNDAGSVRPNESADEEDLSEAAPADLPPAQATQPEPQPQNAQEDSAPTAAPNATSGPSAPLPDQAAGEAPSVPLSEPEAPPSVEVNAEEPADAPQSLPTAPEEEVPAEGSDDESFSPEKTSETNSAPTVTAVSDMATDEDAAFSYDASTHFSDVDAGDSLTYSVDGPDWLTVDAGSGALSGTPDQNDVGNNSFTVTATDSSGELVTASFSVAVAEVEGDVDVLDVGQEDLVDLPGLLPDTETENIAPTQTEDHVEVVATSKHDEIHGGGGDNYIDGLAGNDHLFGDAGSDTLFGAGGNDHLEGGDAADALYGGTGNDKIDGDAGDDFIQGGSGNDNIDGGAGADFISGGSGNDQIDGGAGDDIIYAGGGQNTVNGQDGSDIYVAMEGDGGKTNFSGGSGDGWTDVIVVTNDSGGASPDDSWTIAIEGGVTIEIDSDMGAVDLGEDVSGTLTLSDGTEIDFSELERIEWGNG